VPEVFADKDQAWKVLLALPSHVVVSAGEELGRIAISRQKRILDVCVELQRRTKDRALRFV
jgi:hypothetical protein